MRSTPVLLFLAVLVALPAGGFAERAPLRVGDVEARPGGKASGYLDVPDGVDPGTEIPVTVVHGARPGPVLALVAGTHGYEYPPILALQRLRARLDPASLSGSVILVHFANPTTFYGRRVYYSPDGKNLNRVYRPGLDRRGVHPQDRGGSALLDGPPAHARGALRPRRDAALDRPDPGRHAPATGVWHPVVDQKENVATGALLGRITDPFGNVTHEVHAPSPERCCTSSPHHR